MCSLPAKRREGERKNQIDGGKKIDKLEKAAFEQFWMPEHAEREIEIEREREKERERGRESCLIQTKSRERLSQFGQFHPLSHPLLGLIFFVKTEG